MAERRTTWYMNPREAGPTGVAQVSDALRNRSLVRLPEHILRLAHTEYVHQFGDRQDYERMQERMGLSVLEVVSLLADLADRLGAEPYPMRSPAAAGEQTPEGPRDA